MEARLTNELRRYGATADQLIDLAEAGPETLRFADLIRAPESGDPPTVVRSQGRPLVYVFDGRIDSAPDHVRRWVRRIAFRGDADWVGVLRPGRLDIHPAVLDERLAPIPTADLPDAEFRIPALMHRPGVQAKSLRARLRSLLFASIKRAREDYQLTSRDTLALVGGALFWRFLVDRGLLDDLTPSRIAKGASSWPECLDTKDRSLHTFEWLDATFNGGLLKFDVPPESLPEEVFHRVTGDIAYKADAQGQLSLPERWAEVDFAHIPVGLLSEVYEAVAHDHDKATAAASSLFYTPRHIAEYVVEEVLDALDDAPEPRILDPAAGAGVFLVAAFRALTRREWVRSGLRPSRQAVRAILSNQLTGFDIDADALRLAELALYLTAIELDPEVRPRPLEVLRFRALRGHTLIVHSNGSKVGSLDRVTESDRHRFDAVIGNPPWTALPKLREGGRPTLPPVQAKAIWTEASRTIVEARLGAERAASFSLPDMNPDLPFVYRALEWAKPGGVIGLLTHARWLFLQSSPGLQARKDLLEAVHVTGILNGTDLRKTQVWPNVTHPFCILFARNEPPPVGAAFHFVSPERDTSDSQQDQLRIDWQNAEVVETAEVVRNPWLLKCLYRGNAIDESIVRHVTSRGTQLGVYLEKLGTRLANGYQAFASASAKPAPEMQELPDIRGRDLSFIIDTEQLPRFSRTKLHRSRDRSIYRSPLLLIHESVLVDRFRARTGLSVRDLAYDERFDGISFAELKEGESIARYLQILMQSSLFLHLLLMLDGQLGVEREVVHLQTLESLPIIPWHDLGASDQSNAAGLSRQLAESFSAPIQDAIDRYVFRLYQLSRTQQQAVYDTLATALPTTEAYSEALRSTTAVERRRFSSLLEMSLVETLQISGLDARVTLRSDLPDSLWRFVQIDICEGQHSNGPIEEFPTDEFLEAANEGAASLVVLRMRPGTFLAGILDRYRYWTLTRGRLLASVLLAENGRD